MRAVSHEDLANRLDSGDNHFKCIDKKLDELIEGVQSLTETVEPIRADISTIREITAGWKALGTVGAFVKWASGIALGVLALWAFAKALAKGML